MPYGSLTYGKSPFGGGEGYRKARQRIEETPLEKGLGEVEVQKIVKEEKSSAVMGLLDLVDNVNRLSYGMWGGLKELAEGDFDQIISGAVRGLKRETRYGSRAFLKALDPEGVADLEAATRFSLFGIEMDALSLPLLGADVVLDPINKIPITKLVKGILGFSGRKTAALGRYAESKLLAGASEGTKARYLETKGAMIEAADRAELFVKNMTDKKGYVDKIYKKMLKEGLVDETTNPSEYLEKYYRHIGGKDKRVQDQIRKIVTLESVDKLMTYDEATKLGALFHKASDDVLKGFDDHLAKTLGVEADDVVKATKIHDLLRQIDVAPAKEKEAIISELDELLESSKLYRGAKIKEKILKGDPIKSIVRDIVSLETKATYMVAKDTLKEKVKILKNTITGIGKRNYEIQKAMKNDARVLQKMFVDDVVGFDKEFRGIEKNIDDLLRGSLNEDILPVVTERIKALESRLSGLSKYQTAESVAAAQTLAKKPKLSTNIEASTIKRLIKSKKVPDEMKQKLKQLLSLRKQIREAPIGLRKNLQNVEKGILKEILPMTEGIELFEKSRGISKNVSAAYAETRESVPRLSKYIGDLGRLIQKSQAGEAKLILGESKAELKALFSESRKEVRTMARERMAFFQKTKASAKSFKNLQNELIQKFTQETKDNTELLNLYRKDYNGIQLQIKNLNGELSKKSKLRYDKMLRVFNYLKSIKHQNEVLKEFKDKGDEIFEKFMTNAGMSDDFKGVLRRARKVTTDTEAKLIQEGHLTNGNPFYVRRKIIDETSSLLGSKFISKGKSILKKRTFRYYSELTDWLEKQTGKKVENNLGMIIGDMLQKSEDLIAKSQMEEGLKKVFNIKSLEKMPELKHTVDYLFSGGRNITNTFFDAGFSVLRAVTQKINASLTLPFPAFHFRNTASMIFLSATHSGLRNSLNPKTWMHGLFFIMGDKGDDYAKRLFGKAEINGKSYADIRKAADEFGYFGSSRFRGDLDTQLRFQLGAYKNGKLDPRWWMHKAVFYASMMEDYGRWAGLTAGLKKSHTIEEAMVGARKAMIDYNMLNSPVDKAMQSIIPFYAFSRRNLPNQFANLMNNPRQYAAISKTLMKISNREALSEDDLSIMDPFDKESFKIFGDVVNGVREFRRLGFFPTEEAYQTFVGMTHGDLKQKFSYTMSRMNPFASKFIEWATGKDSYTGDELSNTLGEAYTKLIPPALASKMGLTLVEKPKYRMGQIVGTERVYKGPVSVIFAIRKIPPFSRLSAEFETLMRGDVLGVMTGSKKKTFDREFQNFKAAMSLKEKLEVRALEKGAKKFEITYFPKKPLSPSQKRLQRRKNRGRGRINETERYRQLLR